MIENWQKYPDTGGHDSALLTDLSKDFDCIGLIPCQVNQSPPDHHLRIS